MRVPRSLLRDTAEIEDYIGSGARGPQYQVLRVVRCSVQATNKFMASDDGRNVFITVAMIIRPEDGPVPVESKVTFAGSEYRVVKTFAYPDARRPSHYEVSLTSYAA